MTFTPDTDETPVLFRVSRFREPEGRAAEITAVFPTIPADNAGQMMSCYAHLGQHGSCDLGWYNRTRPATPEEYADLKRELESAPYRYKLKIYHRMQRGAFLAARRAALAQLRGQPNER